MIELRHVKKEFHGITLFEDLNCVINDGDVISLIGPSGGGKSTFLRLINLLEATTGGEILLNGSSITGKNVKASEATKKIGMVFQSFNLFSHLTVLENIMIPQIDLLKRSRQDAYDRAIALLRTVGLLDKAFRYPDDLSGGQQQRIAIARTLAMDTEIILFDEPTSALDPTMVSDVEALIKNLAESGKTMIIVTHDMMFAREISTRVFYIDEGIVYEEGSPKEIFERPKKEKTIAFIKQHRTLSISIEDMDFDFYGVNESISVFARNNGLSRRQINGIMLIFEELISDMLIPISNGQPRIKMNLERAERSTDLSIEVFAKDMPEDILEDDTNLSVMILRGYDKNIKYIKQDNEEYSGCLKLKLAGDK